MFEAVRVGPESRSTPARFAATAARFGFDGVVLRSPAGADERTGLDGIRETYGVQVVPGIEIRTDDPAKCSGYIGTYRPRTPVLIVTGGSREINRFAADQPRVDVLSARRWDPTSIDHVLARTAADNDVRLEVNLHPVLRQTGGDRVRAIGVLRKLVDLVTAYDAPYVVTGDPSSHLGIRGSGELAALGTVVGADGGWIEAGLAEWCRLVKTNQDRLDGSIAAAGVRRGRDEG